MITNIIKVDEIEAETNFADTLSAELEGNELEGDAFEGNELGSYGLQIMWKLKQRAAQAFEPLGLRPNRVLVLESIALGHTQPKDLHKVLGIVPPAISTIVAELEARGLLTRQVDPHDGRRVNLQLTAEGKEIRQQVHRAWNEAHREVHAVLTEKDVLASLELCRKALGVH